MTVIPDAILALVDVCAAALPDARVDDGPVLLPGNRHTSRDPSSVLLQQVHTGPVIDTGVRKRRRAHVHEREDRVRNDRHATPVLTSFCNSSIALRGTV